MEKDPATPLPVGRGFLATDRAVIDCRKAKTAVGEGITRSIFRVKEINLGDEETLYWNTIGKRESYGPRPSMDGIGARPPYYAKKDFVDYHFLKEWEIARDAKLNPFKDVLVFRKMVEFLGAIPINLKGNMLYLMRRSLRVLRSTGYSLKDKNKAKPDKTEHGMEKPLTIDKEGVDWTSHSEEEEDYALMACSSSGSDSYAKLKKYQMSANDKFWLGYGDYRYDGILSYENEVLQSVFMNKESDLENQPLYDMFVTAEGMHVVPPPMTGNYMPSRPDIEIDYSQFTYGPKQSQASEFETQTSDFDTCDLNYSEDVYVSLPTEEQETPSFANKQVKTPRETVKNQFTHSKNPKVDKKGLGYGFTTKACFVCGSLSHLIRDCDFHEKMMAKQAELNNRMRKKSSQREIRPIWNNVQRMNHRNQFVPKAVLTRTGKIPVNTARASGTNTVNTARHNVNRQAVPTNAANIVNTVKPIVNNARPKSDFHKSVSPFRKSLNRTTALRTNFSYQKVNTAEVNAVSAVGGKRETAVKPSAGCNWRPKRHYWHKDYPHRALQNKGIVDSGCSRHMTGNKAYLAEYQDFNGGPVAFGGSKGYITGKGKIKTGKLDFEDVCFVKELQHFNLFSVSQICDKKNKVLFTDSECLVLSPEFKLPDGYHD
ncbi:hypothetical protein Tco_0487705 [Tanacetum coccineum]